MSRMTYLGGHSARKGLLGVLAFPQDLPSDAEYTVFYTTMDDKWMQLQFDFDVAGVTYLKLPEKKYRAWWLVGKRGELVEVLAGKPRVEHIATAGTGPRNKFGYLNQIRVIEDELFVCGHRRQVYRRTDSTWTLISREILDSRKRSPGGFESIDGFSKTDIYAVGRKGEIWHYDGRTWGQCDSPTNQHLADVRCIDNAVWVCGDHGIVLRGDKNTWDVVWDDEEPSESWWGIEGFLGAIYLAGSLCIGKLENGQVSKVDVGIKQEVTSQTLHHKEGILWSIGAEDILAYDGSKWRELISPDNR
jgi:hypothetical protein